MCVWMSKRESKGWDFMLFWKICHHNLRIHYIITISVVFQLPVTFSDLLIFSMIFSHIHSITPNTLSTHYPVFACTIFIHVTQYSKWAPLFNVLINLYKNRHVINVGVYITKHLKTDCEECLQFSDHFGKCTIVIHFYTFCISLQLVKSLKCINVITPRTCDDVLISNRRPTWSNVHPGQRMWNEEAVFSF